MPDEVKQPTNLGFRDRPQWLLALVLVLIGQFGIAVNWLGGFESNTYQFNNGLPDPTGIPEPSTLALVGLALAGIGATARRRKVA